MQNACAAAAAARSQRWLAATVALGLGMLLALATLAALSQGFVYGVDLGQAPIFAVTALLLAACLASLALPRLLPALSVSRVALATLLALGLAMRWLLFDSTPILEIDFYRYLWDGAVTANGFNPYALPPNRVPGSALATLAAQAGPVYERINYPELSSIYPPLAQALFALAHWLEPWRLDGLRQVYLVADLATLGLLLFTLGRLGQSPLWSLLYWWNPLLIVMVYNGLHMDILLLPLVTAALCLLLERRPLAAGVALVLAAGIKLWPLLLVPFALRNLLGQPRQLLSASILLGLSSVILLQPLLQAAWSDHSGLAAFSQYWQRNAALFPQLVQLLAFVSDTPQWHARLAVVIALAVIALRLLYQQPASSPQTIRNLTLLVAALFLLSPVQLPWYGLWLLPFLCFYRHPALLLLLALMPLYFLRFHYDLRGQSEWFDDWIVWLQYLPPLLLWWWHERSDMPLAGVRHA